MKLGNFLFRHRSLTPLPLIAAALLFFRPAAGGFYAATLGGLLLALAGETVRIIAVGFSRSGTSGRESFLRAEGLNNDGIYSLTRNPLYIGNIAIYAGLATAFGNLLLLAIVMAWFAAQYALIVRSEERFLEATHGESYAAYRRATPRWFPAFGNYRSPAAGFNARKVVFKEKDSLFNLLLLFFLISFWRFRVSFSREMPLALLLAVLLPLILIYIVINIVKRKSFHDGGA